MLRIGRRAFFTALAVALFAAPSAYAADSVKVKIDVLEGSDKSGKIAPALLRQPAIKTIVKRFHLKGLKQLDRLEANVRKGSTVTLQLPNRKHNLKVTLLQHSVEATKLRIAVPELKFKSDTTHKKGAPLVVGLPTKSDVATFLVVKPQK